MENIKVEIIKSPEDANPLPIVHLGPPERELLLLLNNSDGWKLYRRVLLEMKSAYTNQALACKDTNECFKLLGMIAGLNVAINTLVQSKDLYNKQVAKRVEDETKNPPRGQGYTT